VSVTPSPFAIPPVSPARTAVIRAAAQFLKEGKARHSDARDLLKGLVAHFSARVSYPSYRTALRCGDIYSEAAASCDLATARILLSSFSEKAQHYLQGVCADG
jgi:hypothetical protein